MIWIKGARWLVVKRLFDIRVTWKATKPLFTLRLIKFFSALSDLGILAVSLISLYSSKGYGWGRRAEVWLPPMQQKVKVWECLNFHFQRVCRFAFKYALATHLEWHQLEEKDLTKSRVEEGEVREEGLVGKYFFFQLDKKILQLIHLILTIIFDRWSRRRVFTSVPFVELSSLG